MISFFPLTLLIVFFSFSIFGKSFSSPEHKLQLVELFTSQSCSSCPPAESWMNSMKFKEGLYKEFVPIEFHVDYWNYLHWRDPFSKPEFTKRQREYNRKLKAGVYTPQYIVDGKDEKNWWSKKDKLLIAGIKVGKISGNLDKRNKKIKYSFIPPKQSNESLYICHITEQLAGQATKIPRGENAGKTLKHEFIVLRHLNHLSNLKNGKINCEFEKLQLTKIDKISIWISDRNKRIIQAFGMKI